MTQLFSGDLKAGGASAWTAIMTQRSDRQGRITCDESKINDFAHRETIKGHLTKLPPNMASGVAMSKVPRFALHSDCNQLSPRAIRLIEVCRAHNWRQAGQKAAPYASQVPDWN